MYGMGLLSVSLDAPTFLDAVRVVDCLDEGV